MLYNDTNVNIYKIVLCIFRSLPINEMIFIFFMTYYYKYL